MTCAQLELDFDVNRNGQDNADENLAYQGIKAHSPIIGKPKTNMAATNNNKRREAS